MSKYTLENRYSNALVSTLMGSGALAGSAGSILWRDSRVMLYTSRWPSEVRSEMRVDRRAKGFSGRWSGELSRGDSIKMGRQYEMRDDRDGHGRDSLVHLHLVGAWMTSLKDSLPLPLLFRPGQFLLLFAVPLVVSTLDDLFPLPFQLLPDPLQAL